MSGQILNENTFVLRLTKIIKHKFDLDDRNLTRD